MNIPSARVQFAVGAVSCVATLAVAVLGLIPQFQLSRQYQQPQATLTIASLEALKDLPQVRSSRPTSWEEGVLGPVRQLNHTVGTQLVRAQGTLAQAEVISALPPEIKKVPLTLSVKGTYAQLQTFQRGLLQRFPDSALRSMNYKVSPEALLKPGSPSLMEVTLLLDLVVAAS